MTTVAIHQPHYLPWLPYLDKVEQADIFVYLDNVSYQKNGFQNRNYLKSKRGSIRLTVPVHANLGMLIHDVCIADNHWRKKHVKMISQCYADAPYINLFFSELKPILDQEWHNLVELNIAVTEWMLRNINASCQRLRASEIDASGFGENLLIEICRALGATEYLSGQGAVDYQDPDHFEKRGIKLRYQSYREVEYPQCYSQLGFVKGLSALDLILNAGPRSREILLEGRQ